MCVWQTWDRTVINSINYLCVQESIRSKTFNRLTARLRSQGQSESKVEAPHLSDFLHLVYSIARTEPEVYKWPYKKHEICVCWLLLRSFTFLFNFSVFLCMLPQQLVNLNHTMSPLLPPCSNHLNRVSPTLPNSVLLSSFARAKIKSLCSFLTQRLLPHLSFQGRATNRFSNWTGEQRLSPVCVC